jgi:hypothetical protein
MDRHGYASPFSRPLLLALPPLFSFPPVSLYPVHSLSETPLNRHRNVYVKLTPQNHPNFLVDGTRKFGWFWEVTEVSVYILYIEDVHIVWNWYSDDFSKFRVVELSQFLWKIVTYTITVHGLCSYCQRLLQFSTQIFQTLQNVCTYNENVHITEWHLTRDMICRSNRKRGVYMYYFLFNQ